jgi:hypothetical protein
MEKEVKNRWNKESRDEGMNKELNREGKTGNKKRQKCDTVSSFLTN